MVKYQITKEEYDALSPELKAEYKESGDAYKLDVSGIDAKAQDKLEGERSKRRDAEKAAREAADKLQEFQDGDDRPAMIDKHTKDIAKIKAAKEASELKLSGYIRRNTLEKDADNLARGLSSVNAKVLLPHITSRLDVDLTDPDNPKTVVLGADGKPTDKSLDDLRAEFVANKDFAGIITASQATGGAASRPGVTDRRGLPSGTGTTPTQRPTNFGDMQARDLAAHITAKRVAEGKEVPATR